MRLERASSNLQKGERVLRNLLTFLCRRHMDRPIDLSPLNLFVLPVPVKKVVNEIKQKPQI